MPLYWRATWIIIFIFPQLSNAQSDDLDSLLRAYIQMNVTSSDRNEQLQHQIYVVFSKLPLEKVDQYILTELDNFDQMSLQTVRLTRLRGYAYSHTYLAHATTITRNALETAQKIGIDSEIAECYMDLGIYYRRLGFYTYASEFQRKAAKLFLETDPRNAGHAFYAAALTSYKAGNYKQSLDEQMASLKNFDLIEPDALTDNDIFFLMSGWNTLGLNHTELGNYELALSSFSKADSIARIERGLFDKDFWIALIGGNVGSVYLKLKQPENAWPLLKADFVEMQIRSDTKMIINSALYLVKACVELGKIDSAFLLIHQLKKYPEAKNNDKYWRELSRIYETTGILDSALYSMIRLAALKDSLQMASESSNLSILKTIYEFDELNDSINTLTSTMVYKQKRIQNQIVIFSIILTMLSILLVMYYLFNKRNKKQLRIIEFQNKKILQQKSDLQNAFEEQKATQDQLIISAKLSSIGQMTAGIAHEINNPLNFISGGVQALKHQIGNLILMAGKSDMKYANEIKPEINDLLRSVDNGVKRCTSIISSLKTMSSAQVNFEKINIIEPMEMAFEILKGRIKQEAISVKKNYPKNIIKINGNISQLSQVFGNLLANAIQSMKDSPAKKLTIDVKQLNQKIVIRIIDTGCGIPLNIRDKIMEPFFTTKDPKQGTGLGLYISYGIIKKHNGNLTFKSLEKGTEFTLTF